MSFIDDVFACSLSGDVAGLQNAIVNDTIEKKHWVDCRWKCGDTPLHIAARNGNLEIVR